MGCRSIFSAAVTPRPAILTRTDRDMNANGGNNWLGGCHSRQYLTKRPDHLALDFLTPIATAMGGDPGTLSMSAEKCSIVTAENCALWGTGGCAGR